MKLLEVVKSDRDGKKDVNTCCLCLCPLGINESFGNNPWPLSGEKCCDKCNFTKVIPTRIALGRSVPDITKNLRPQ